MKSRLWLPVCFCSALLVAGEDKFWEKQEVSAWTPSQVTQFTTSSPWAKQVTAILISNDSNMPETAPRSGGGGHTAVISSRGKSDSDTRLDIPKFQAMVRWVSAPAMRKILKTKLPLTLDGRYVISVSGLPFGGDPASTAEHTTLQIKRGEAVHPETVYQDPNNTATIYFAFLPSMVDVASGRNAEFDMFAPPFEVRTKFNLTEMKVKGAPSF